MSELTRQSYRGHDAKYGAVTVERLPGNPFEADEPVFLLRGRDTAAPGAILAYADECRAVGAPAEHVAAIEAAADAMRQWQAGHVDRVKVPD